MRLRDAMSLGATKTLAATIRRSAPLLCALALGLVAPSAWACVTIGNGDCSNGAGFGSKWDSTTWGTGATITWSFMDAGVGLSGDAPANLSGTNQLGSGSGTDIRSIIDATNGAGAFDAAVARAFATWSSAANLTFNKVADNGAAAAGTTAIDIRIGAYAFTGDTTTGGVGYGPPGIDDNACCQYLLAGNIYLNTNNQFAIDPGTEGALLGTGPGGLYLNDVEGLLLHEIGHALGLAHTSVYAAVMCGYPNDCDITHVNRQLDPDDIAGIQLIYGPAPVPLPAAAWLLLSGLVGMGALTKRKVAPT